MPPKGVNAVLDVGAETVFRVSIVDVHNPVDGFLSILGFFQMPLGSFLLELRVSRGTLRVCNR